MCSNCTETPITLEEARRFARAVKSYIESKENPSMTATTVTAKTAAPTAAKTKITVQKTVEATEDGYTVTMTALQAGYLRDLLLAHVSGEVALFLRPISTALGNAGAAREYAQNTNLAKAYSTTHAYPKAWAVVDFEDDYERERAGIATTKAKLKF